MPDRKSRQQLEAAHVVVLAIIGFALRIALIHFYPPIFGGDSVTRLFHHDQIVIAYQLPALQASIHALMNFTENPLWVRYWMALIGATAGVGFYLLARDLFSTSVPIGTEVPCSGRIRSLLTALLFVAHPFVLAESTVPYQEILMLAALFFAFHSFFAERWVPASLALGLACLTRYEAWAACPVLAFAYARARGWRPAEVLKALALFGWAPLAWAVYAGGIAPAGTYVVESRFSLARLARYFYLGWITAKFTPVPVLLLAALGLWTAWRERLLANDRVRVVAAFVALFLLAILFSAHGETRDPERFVTAREAHIPIVAVLLVAGLAVARFRRMGALLAGAGFILGVFGAARYMAAETSEPRLQLAYRLAGYLDRTVGPHETALILVEPIPEERIQAYLERARRQGGDKGLASARAVLSRGPATPPDFPRIVVHSRAARHRLRTLVSASISPQARQAVLAAPPPDWMVIWSDFTPADDDERRLERLATGSGPPVETLRSGALTASVYKIQRPVL